MDIQYLLWLQEWRNATNNALTPLFEQLSYFGTRDILLIPAFIYWCLNKRSGLFILFSYKLSQTINSLVKLTACIYRPWVRDPRIIPAGDSIKTAGGYSFPSGHTMTFTPIYGGLIAFTKNKLVRFVCAALIIVTAFSRNYLGVHTPQDVIVGILLGVLSVYIGHKVFAYLDKHPENDAKVMIIFALMGILTMVYITYKPYPMDYNADGKLIVDPVKMQIDSWGDAGAFAPFILAWYVESRFVKFEPTGFNVKGVILCIVGMIPLHYIIWNLGGVMQGILGPHAGKLASKSIMLFYIVVFWPIVIKLFSRKRVL
ncbi:MAG: phosphatase PAP2 family protein [Synergistaceae bacterium]|nr:phosphatase PAP2 family protein [Synergistaceae bacterium]MBQ6002798.1 phosphatase PAP2 family protein [Synergistaceae bacterium]